MENKYGWVHRLVEKDTDALRGVCSNCGPVDLLVRQRQGETIYRCAIKRRDEHQNHLRRGKHGLTKVEADILKENQVCEICGDSSSLVIDHCHESRKVRGVLCNSCNLGLGFFKDNAVSLESAIKYLKK